MSISTVKVRSLKEFLKYPIEEANSILAGLRLINVPSRQSSSTSDLNSYNSRIFRLLSLVQLYYKQAGYALPTLPGTSFSVFGNGQGNQNDVASIASNLKTMIHNWYSVFGSVWLNGLNGVVDAYLRETNLHDGVHPDALLPYNITTALSGSTNAIDIATVAVLEDIMAVYNSSGFLSVSTEALGYDPFTDYYGTVSSVIPNLVAKNFLTDYFRKGPDTVLLNDSDLTQHGSGFGFFDMENLNYQGLFIANGFVSFLQSGISEVAGIPIPYTYEFSEEMTGPKNAVRKYNVGRILTRGSAASNSTFSTVGHVFRMKVKRPCNFVLTLWQNGGHSDPESNEFDGNGPMTYAMTRREATPAVVIGNELGEIALNAGSARTWKVTSSSGSMGNGTLLTAYNSIVISTTVDDEIVEFLSIAGPNIKVTKTSVNSAGSNNTLTAVTFPFVVSDVKVSGFENRFINYDPAGDNRAAVDRTLGTLIGNVTWGKNLEAISQKVQPVLDAAEEAYGSMKLRGIPFRFSTVLETQFGINTDESKKHMMFSSNWWFGSNSALSSSAKILLFKNLMLDCYRLIES